MKLLLVFIFIFLGINAVCQSFVKIFLPSKSVKLSLESSQNGFTIDLKVNNGSLDTISYPRVAKTNNRKIYSADEVGYYILHHKKEVKCQYDHDYPVSPRMEKILPGQNCVIKTLMLGDCFRKGKYFITFYIKWTSEGISKEISSKRLKLIFK